MDVDKFGRLHLLGDQYKGVVHKRVKMQSRQNLIPVSRYVSLKVGIHQATSCCNTSRGQITPCVQVGRLVAATKCGDTSQRQIAPCVLENFCENLCRCNRICRRNKSHRFSLTLFFATCCSGKILLRKQRFSQKFSGTHGAICRCDVSLHFVAATSRPTCTHGVICRHDVLQQLVAQCIPTFTIPTSQPNKNRKSRSRSLSKFPLLAPIFNSNPVYHHKRQPNPASCQTYCGPSNIAV